MKLKQITIISFGHKYGPPPAANLLFDVRFIKNPHYDEQLRPLTGMDQPVQRFFENEPPAVQFLSLLKNLLRQTVVGYLAHGNDHNSLTIAFGCTGGKHRSVYFAVQSESILRELVREFSLTSRVLLEHRDKGRE
jgi:RNase adapter protein RapZ